ncbi:MAG TPA: heavy-metal-associated domain-containing protein [Longimicrobium sp.]|nr:heavy-metal-associated domain-containing protein [Longimicrobium sp.]
MAAENTIQTLDLSVTGMTCGSCRRHVEEALLAVPGVTSARVDLARGAASVTCNAATAGVAELIGAVREAGYHAEASPAAADAGGLPIVARSCSCRAA